MMLPELVKESHGFNRGSMSKFDEIIMKSIHPDIRAIAENDSFRLYIVSFCFSACKYSGS